MKVIKYLFLISLVFSFSCMSMYKALIYDTYHSLVFSPNKQYLACTNLNKILIFRTDNWSIHKELKRHTNKVHHIAFSPEGKILVSSGRDKMLIFWDTKTWDVIQEHEKINKGNISFSHDGKFFALDRYNAILFGDAVLPSRIFSLYPLLSSQKIINEARYQQIVFSPTESYFLSYESNGVLKKISLPDFKLLNKFQLETTRWFNIQFLNEEDIILQNSTGVSHLLHYLFIYSLKNGKIKSRINIEDFNLSTSFMIHFMHVFENDKILLTCKDRLLIYSISEKSIIRKLEINDYIHQGAANNKFVVFSTYNSSGEGKVLVYELNDLKFVKELRM